MASLCDEPCNERLVAGIFPQGLWVQLRQPQCWAPMTEEAAIEGLTTRPVCVAMATPMLWSLWRMMALQSLCREAFTSGNCASTLHRACEAMQKELAMPVLVHLLQYSLY